MCATEEQIREKLKDLPEVPAGLISMTEPGTFHGVIEWKVLKGRMISFREFDHPNCEIFHTRFSKDTEVAWHHHGEESDEIIICLSGEMTLLFADGTKHVLQEMDRIEIDRQIKHMALIGNKPCEIIAMTIPKEK